MSSNTYSVIQPLGLSFRYSRQFRLRGRIRKSVTSHCYLGEKVPEKFARLRDEWKAKRGSDSSSMKLAMYPASVKIIGMGADAVTLLLRELATAPGDPAG